MKQLRLNIHCADYVWDLHREDRPARSNASLVLELLRAVWGHEVLDMDADRLRARFIKRQLHRALDANDTTFADMAAREFRRYVEWFKHLLPERDKEHIVTQLSMLENKIARRGRHGGTDHT